MTQAKKARWRSSDGVAGLCVCIRGRSGVSRPKNKKAGVKATQMHLCVGVRVGRETGLGQGKGKKEEWGLKSKPPASKTNT